MFNRPDLIGIGLLLFILVGCVESKHQSALQIWRSPDSTLKQRADAVSMLVPKGASMQSVMSILGTNGAWTHAYGPNTEIFWAQPNKPSRELPNYDVWRFDYDFPGGGVSLYFDPPTGTGNKFVSASAFTTGRQSQEPEITAADSPSGDTQVSSSNCIAKNDQLPPVPINDASTNDEPALISAVLNGQKDRVKSLLAENAEVNVRNKNGWTPLHCAALKNRADLAELLIAHGAEIDATNNPGATPLDVAAVNGSTDAAKLLIAHKADIHGEDVRTGWTPLHGAAFEGYIGMAKLLLANGADINAKDNDGMTPLYWALVKYQKNMVELLLTNHADVNIKDKDGNTPLRYAVSHEEGDIADLLRQHGGHE